MWLLCSVMDVICLADGYRKGNFIAVCTRDVLLCRVRFGTTSRSIEKLEADKREMEVLLRLRKHVNTAPGECESTGLTRFRSRPSGRAVEIIM
jgi:hypothetical protein